MANANEPYESMFSLKEMVALVSGGGSGIGYMIATGLASKGAKVYIAGRRKEVLEKVAAGWQGNGALIPLSLDVTDKESIMAAKKILQEKEGKLHALVNNAGQVGPMSKFMKEEGLDAESIGQKFFDNESFDDWSKLYQIDTFSIWFMTMAFLGLLEKGTQDIGDTFTASVINITSISGITKLAQDHFCYNSSKAAATHLSKMLSTELALKHIPVRVNSIAPGVYESEMTMSHVDASLVDKIGKGVMPVPAKRAGRDSEIAGAAVYLASRAGCYTNGQELVVDGGYTAVNPSRV